jgi:hypothetical protein
MSSSKAKSNNEANADDFVNIDDVSGELTKCHQIQIGEDGKASPVYIGSYKEIPLVTHTTIVYDQSKDMLNAKQKKVEKGKRLSKSEKKKARENKSKKNIYRVHVVTYLMPEESIQNDIFKIVGLIIQKNKEVDSVASLDLRFNKENNKYEYIFCDHGKDTVEVTKTLKKFPGQDVILTNLIEQMFEDPVKSLILS